MGGLSWLDVGLLGLGAVLVGFAKTAIGGVSGLSVAIFAAVLPARESTGALLPLLLVGDVFAVRAYRRHADWAALRRLFPSVAVGVLIGVVFTALADDTAMRRTIGGLLLAITAVHLVRRRGGGNGGQGGSGSNGGNGRSSPHRAAAPVFGWLAGFTTMVANAGGAVMSLYLLSSGFAKLGFLGTGAWFFLLVNLFKLPFSAALGLITPESLALDAALAGAVVVGALVGRRVVHRLDGAAFERLVLLFTVVSALNLLR